MASYLTAGCGIGSSSPLDSREMAKMDLTAAIFPTRKIRGSLSLIPTDTESEAEIGRE